MESDKDFLMKTDKLTTLHVIVLTNNFLSYMLVQRLKKVFPQKRKITLAI